MRKNLVTCKKQKVRTNEVKNKHQASHKHCSLAHRFEIIVSFNSLNSKTTSGTIKVSCLYSADVLKENVLLLLRFLLG